MLRGVKFHQSGKDFLINKPSEFIQSLNCFKLMLPDPAAPIICSIMSLKHYTGTEKQCFLSVLKFIMWRK